MSDKIENPHDKFFKESFSRKSSVVPFLKAYLPAEVKQLIAFETLETENSHFVDEDLQESISDLIYRVQIAGQTSYLYLLFEHIASSIYFDKEKMGCAVRMGVQRAKVLSSS